MDSIFGITGKDFVLIAADKSVTQSIIKMQDDDNKLIELGNNQILGSVADVSARKDFSKLIKANVNYYYYRYGNRLLTKETAHFTRKTVWDSLRSRKPYQVASLVAGFDEGEPNLYLIEQLGSMEKVTRGAIGYCSHFLYGLMDNCYKKDFSLEEGVDCIKKCIKELKTRFLVNLVNFDVVLIDKDGAKNISSEFN
jgi:20S proteasome subunit beta 4